MKTFSVGLYPNIKSKSCNQIKLDSLVELIRTGSTSPVKDESPVVTYNYNFTGGKSNANATSPTGLIFCDYDKCKHQPNVDVEAIKKEYFDKFNCIAAAYTSHSGKGIHFVVDVSFDILNFKSSWDQLNNLFDNGLDVNSRKLTQPAYIPADPGILFRESTCTFEPIKLNIESKPEVDDSDLGFDFTEMFGSPVRFRDYLPNNKFKSINKPVIVERNVFDIDLTSFKHFKVKEGKRTRFLGYLSLQLIGLNPQANLDQLIANMIYLNHLVCEIPQERNEVVNIITNNYNRYIRGELNLSKYKKKKMVHWHPECQLDGYSKQQIAISLYSKYKRNIKLEKIVTAINEIILQGRDKVSRKKVSEISGIKVQNIQRYWSKFKDDTTIKEYNRNYSEAIKLLKKVSFNKNKKVSSVSFLYKEEVIRTNDTFSDKPNDTFLKIQSAIEAMEGKITQKKVSMATGFSIITIKRYWKHVKPKPAVSNQPAVLDGIDRLLSMARKNKT